MVMINTSVIGRNLGVVRQFCLFLVKYNLEKSFSVSEVSDFSIKWS